MQRIIIEKNEAVADIVERILEIQDREIVLVVPKGSRLTDSASNFRLIAREGGVLAKNISVESVDEEILERAKAAGLTASHPLFGARAKAAEGQSFSDIVPRGASKKPAKKLHVTVEPEADTEEEIEEAAEPEEATDSEPAEIEELSGEEPGSDAWHGGGEEVEERYDTLQEPQSRNWRKKALVWGIIVIVLILGGMWLTASAFGRATISITFQESPWNYNGTVTAAVAAKNVDANAATIPAELVEPQETLTGTFPATGRSSGGQKAHATITIVNEFSGAPQELVATTRFLTPDGKLFRLDSGIVVPGATVDASGKVTASSTIKAAVTADQAGPDYNLGAVARLNIPGFQGTAKYNGFYGSLPDGASGGSLTSGTTPTASDITKAKADMAGRLSDGLQSKFLASVPAGFKVLPQAIVLATTTYNVNQSVDSQGNFSVVAITKFQAFEFREADAEALLNGKAQAANPGKVLQDLTLTYNNVTPSVSKKQLTFTLDAKGTLAPEFDAQAFAASIAGKSQEEARQAIQGLPGLAAAKVSLWPAWLWKLPGNTAKVSVQVQ